MSGESSSAESGAITDIIAKLLSPIFGKDFLTPHVVRKAAHFTEFFILGVLGSSFLRSIGKESFFAESYAFLCGLAVAVIDETIQIISPDRGPSVKDVLLDASGVLCGIAVCFALIRISLRIRARRAARSIDN